MARWWWLAPEWLLSRAEAPSARAVALATGLRVAYLSAGVVVVDKPTGLKSVPAFGPASEAARAAILAAGRWPKRIERWREILVDHAPPQVAAKSAYFSRKRDKFLRMLGDRRVTRPPISGAEGAALWERLVALNAEREAAEGWEETDSVATRLNRAGLEAKPAHRLDEATSGALVFGRGVSAVRDLSQQWRRRTVEKRYEALLEGRVVRDSARIRLPLRRRLRPTSLEDDDDEPPHEEDEEEDDSPRAVPLSRQREQRMEVDVSLCDGDFAAATASKACDTEYRVLARDDSRHLTHVELTPHTGRLHQLRAHCAAIGHPILGDDSYAAPAVAARATRLCLHATTVSFTDPATGTLERVRTEPAAWGLIDGSPLPSPPATSFFGRARRIIFGGEFFFS